MQHRNSPFNPKQMKFFKVGGQLLAYPSVTGSGNNATAVPDVNPNEHHWDQLGQCHILNIKPMPKYTEAVLAVCNGPTLN